MLIHDVAEEDTMQRIGILASRLEETMREARELRARVTKAARQARSWPDMSRATQLFVDLQRPVAPPPSPERN